MGEYGGKALPEFGFRVYDSGLVKGFLVMCRVFGFRVYDLGSVKGVLAVFSTQGFGSSSKCRISDSEGLGHGPDVCAVLEQGIFNILVAPLHLAALRTSLCRPRQTVRHGNVYLLSLVACTAFTNHTCQE